MKKLLLLSAVFLGITVAQGQTLTFAPTGAKWTFGVGYSFSSTIEYREWISQGDTLVGGQNCKLIKGSGTYVQSDISNTLFVYEDSNRVYLYNTSINQFTVLYDFNKNTGDTWTIKTDTCDLVVTVYATGMDTINGFPLKTLSISTQDGSFNGKVIQHIGNIDQFTPDVVYHCTGIIVDYNGYTGLRCYEDSILGFQDFNIAPNCYFTTSTYDIDKNLNQINIFPNPFSTQTTLHSGIPLTNATLTLYNSYGQQVKQFAIRNSDSFVIRRDNLPSGLYFIRLSTPSPFSSPNGGGQEGAGRGEVIATGKLVITD